MKIPSSLFYLIQGTHSVLTPKHNIKLILGLIRHFYHFSLIFSDALAIVAMLLGKTNNEIKNYQRTHLKKALSKHLVYVWNELNFLTYLHFQLIFTTIHGYYCTF